MKKTIPIILFLIFATGVFSACAPTQTQLPPGMGETWAAFTMAAVMTQSAFGTLEAKLTQVSASTPTPQETPSPQMTTTNPLTSIKPAQTTSNAGAACNWAGFVSDVTIPDGTQMEPDLEFTKTWRIKNLGSCTWTKKYGLIHSGGEIMGAPDTVYLPIEVSPGSEVEVSVKMKAPQVFNTYTSYWLLQDDKGGIFGIGSSGKGPIYLKITVGKGGGLASAHDVYNLADNYCSAGWFSGKGRLSCPGSTSEETGSISSVSSALMEGNMQSDLPTLITIPSSGQNGSISGQFPPLQVMYGDRFQTKIGCLSGFPACDVSFQLSYKGQDGQTRTLVQKGHTQDSYVDDLDVDLGSAAGSSIELILTVMNNGSSTDDRAFWVYPRVVRP
jgi:hypothetical protein